MAGEPEDVLSFLRDYHAKREVRGGGFRAPEGKGAVLYALGDAWDLV